MIIFVEYLSGVSPLARLRNASLYFWDFNAMQWVDTANANTYSAFAEAAHGDGMSIYSVNISLPPGAPYAWEAYLASGEVIDFGTTALDAQVSGIPSNPLLTNDARLDYLDVAVSSLDPPTAQEIWEYTTRELTVPSSGATAAQVWAYETRALTDKAGFSLSTAGILAIWNQATAAAGVLVNTMGAKVRDFVLGSDNKVMVSTDAQDLSATLDVNAKTVEDKTGYALASAYDAAKTAATQASVNAIPTAPLLAADARLDNLDASIAAIPTTTLLAVDYTAPDNASIATILSAIQNATYGLSQLDTEIDGITTALSSLATDADVQTVLTRLTDVRAGLIDNLQYLTGVPGLTQGQIDIITEARDEAQLSRQMQTNKAVISPDGLTVTIYADDDTTPLWTFSVPDNKTRVPA